MVPQIHLLQAGCRITALQQNHSRTTATSQPHCTRNKAEPQPHHSRITTESQPQDRPPATKGELCFSSETSIRWFRRITAEPHTVTSYSNHSRLIASSQLQEPLRSRRSTCFKRAAESQHCSRATSQPHCTRNKAEPQPHHCRITTESQPHDRHTRAESPCFEL